jgi:hypothetical protein
MKSYQDPELMKDLEDQQMKKLQQTIAKANQEQA